MQASVRIEPQSPLQLSLVALAGIALLLLLVVRGKVHAFPALLLVSVLVGLGAQYPNLDPEKVLAAMQRGMGGTLGFVAVVVGLGAMFGRLLELSGGAQALARGLLARFGVARAPWALGVAGFLVSIPVFFDVAFIVLIPLVVELAKKSGRPLMALALPLLAGLLVTHAFVPPTPGPIGVASILHADLGYVILFGALAGVPAMALGGPVFARFVSQQVPGRLPETETSEASVSHPVSLGLSLGLIALPIGLILLSTAAAAVVGDAHLTGAARATQQAITLLGHPFIALLLTTLLCFRVLGTRRGLSPKQVSEVATQALEPTGVILLVTGAGGVLKQVLVDTAVGKAVADQLSGLGATPVLLSFALALLVRVLQGSATVAMLTAASLVLPLADAAALSVVQRSLLVLPIAAGASAFSHVNDSGFWLVNRYLGLSVTQTLRTWTAMSAIVGAVGLLMALCLWPLVH